MVLSIKYPDERESNVTIPRPPTRFLQPLLRSSLSLHLPAHPPESPCSGSTLDLWSAYPSQSHSGLGKGPNFYDQNLHVTLVQCYPIPASHASSRLVARRDMMQEVYSGPSKVEGTSGKQNRRDLVDCQWTRWKQQLGRAPPVSSKHRSATASSPAYLQKGLEKKVEGWKAEHCYSFGYAESSRKDQEVRYGCLRACSSRVAVALHFRAYHREG